jgi:TPR repeat protein
MSNPIHNIRARLRDLGVRAAHDDLDALQELWEVYTYGIPGDNGSYALRPNLRKANAYEERAAQLGDPGSMTAVADRIARKSFTGARRREAIRLYVRAFRAGYATAAYNLAVRYKDAGEHRMAVAWFRRALKAGEPSALLELGKAELYGAGIRRNPTSALAKLRRAARATEEYFPNHWYQCQAMITMATALLSGWNAPRDIEAGLRWLERAAQLGSAVAREILESPKEFM